MRRHSDRHPVRDSRPGGAGAPAFAAFSMPAAVLLVAAVLAGAGGCAAPPTGPRGLPRYRTGGLPFPGLFSLYATADPLSLGRHRAGYEQREPADEEVERGIVYTTRAGFLDIAHVRITVDTTRYCVEALRGAVARGDTTLTLNGSNKSLFHVTLCYPPGWADAPAAGRDALADALCLRAGQRLAYLMMTWHELASWFGQRQLFFIDETPSAFTWEDTMSHVVGIRVAERALGRAAADSGEDAFDDAVTAALDSELLLLGAVAPSETDEAVRAVRGRWWAGGRPLKRQVDVGLSDDVVYPWLVPGLWFVPPATAPRPFRLPREGDVLGPGAPEFCTVLIEPRIEEAARMRRLLPGRPEWFSRDRDVPLLLEAVRRQMRRRFGEQVDEPWPAPADASVAAAPKSRSAGRQRPLTAAASISPASRPTANAPSPRPASPVANGSAQTVRSVPAMAQAAPRRPG